MHWPVVSDASAALTALRANPGLPTHGVIVLCDFGGSGTSITLADAASEFAPIGHTVRFSDFSGDHLDQALLTHVVAGFVDASHADAASTAMVGSLAQLRGACRAAKERLSAETATAVVVDLPAHRSDIRVTRTELEDLIQAPLAGFLVALDDTLQRSGVAAASVSAVATVGGGARIPLVTQRLSEHLRAPVVTTLHPQLTAAAGAALIASRSRVADSATVITPASTAAALTTAVGAGAPSATFRALAWSEDAQPHDVAPQAGADADADVVHQGSRPELHFRRNEGQQPDEPPRRSPIVLFGLAAAAAMIAATAYGVTLLSSDTTTPVDAATTVTTSPAPAAPASLPAPPAPQAPQVTTVVVQAPAAVLSGAATTAAASTRHAASGDDSDYDRADHDHSGDDGADDRADAAPDAATRRRRLPSHPPSTRGLGDGGTTPPPIDPGPGDGAPDAGTPPIDPGTGGGSTDHRTPS